MKQKSIIIVFFVIIALIPISIFAESSDTKGVVKRGNEYGGSFVGGGVAFYNYNTHWYWYNSYDPVGSREHYPIHLYSRPQMFGFYEMRSVFNLGPLSFDARGELQFTFIGGTKEDWLPSGETISSGGIVVGGNAIFKCVYPMVLRSIPLSPFIGLGVNISFITSNGKNVGTEFANRVEYDYESGWNDSLYILFLDIGTNIEFSSFQIIPEIRFSILGGASTSWEPMGYAPENESAGFFNIQLSIGYKI